MKRHDLSLCAAFIAVFICTILSGCAELPLKEGGIAIGKDTTAGIDDIGVGRVTSQF